MAGQKDRPELTALIAKAREVWDNMNDEEKEAMLRAQRESWVRGEAGLDD